MSTQPTSETPSPSSATGTPSRQETQDRTICIRSVKTSCLLGLAIFLLCYASHHANWAWGFLIGGLLSLFSMVSLMLAVPFLTWPGAPRHMSALLIVTLFLKLPIFCLGLYLATHLPGVSAFACCIGICLTPAAITLKAVSNLLQDMLPVRESKAVAPAKPEAAETPVEAKPIRKVSPRFVGEEG